MAVVSIKILIPCALLVLLVGCNKQNPQWNMNLPHYSQHYIGASDSVVFMPLVIKKATAEQKRIFVIMGGEWCGWCNNFSDFLTDNPDAADSLLANFVVVKLKVGQDDYRPSPLVTSWPEFYGVPHYYILDQHGELIESVLNSEFLVSNDYHEQTFIDFIVSR